jgi:hypothetical protein
MYVVCDREIEPRVLRLYQILKHDEGDGKFYLPFTSAPNTCEHYGAIRILVELTNSHSSTLQTGATIDATADEAM